MIELTMDVNPLSRTPLYRGVRGALDVKPLSRTPCAGA